MRRFVFISIAYILIVVIAISVTWAIGLIQTSKDFFVYLGATLVGVATIMALFTSILKNDEKPHKASEEEVFSKPLPNSGLDEPLNFPSSEELPPPGPLPPGSRLQYLRNTVFTGREDYLLTLAKALFYDQHPATITPLAIATGIGGIGKTQLAVELCYRYGRFLTGVHWINADQDIDAEIAACGALMNLKPWPPKIPEQVALTLLEWQSTNSRLVVLDNLEDPQILIKLLPLLGSLCILITARQVIWPPEIGLQESHLNELPRPESLALLRKLASRLEKFSDHDLDPIAERLCDLPLALHTAGLIMRKRSSLTPVGYLDEVDNAGGVLKLKLLPRSMSFSPTDHDLDLLATIHVSWSFLEGYDLINQLAQKIFIVSGYFAQNVPIPKAILALSVIEKPAEIQPDGILEDSVRNYELGLDRLFELGLLEPAEEGPFIHPLMAEFARIQDKMQDESVLPNLSEALGKLSDSALESQLPGNFTPLLPHILSVAEAAQENELNSASWLWSNLGAYLNSVAEYDGAKKVIERALEIDEVTFGPDHPNVAVRLSNLGSVLQSQGDMAGAITMIERALAIDEAFFGPDDTNVAGDFNNLGYMLKIQGDLEEAKVLFEKALAILVKDLGPEHPKVSITINNLASVLQAQGDLEEAKVLFEKALAIDNAIFGSDHPSVAGDFNNLGSVLHIQGDLEGAKDLYEKSLAILVKDLGPEHPDVVLTFDNLGDVLQDQGDLEGAKAMFERVLAINEKRLGSDHPKVLAIALKLGDVLHAQGDLDGAIAMYERALAIAEKHLGSDHPYLVIITNNLERILHDLGDLANGESNV